MPASSSHHIRVDGVSRSYGDRTVFSDLSLLVDSRDRAGLIGENGAGKSTLLRLIAGAEHPDRGSVSAPARTSLLWQEVRFDPSVTVERLLEEALSEIRDVENELEAAAVFLGSGGADAATRYERALAAAERADIWSTDARVAEVLAGLGVDGIPLGRRLDEVSGGQRSRFALAALLLERPTALLLDEPTNHLDDSAVDFLRRQLMAWSGPVMFASHDRAFLDEVATVLIDIDESRSGATRFGATAGRAAYTAYLDAKAAERRRWEQQFADEQKELLQLADAVAVTARNVAPNRPKNDNEKMGYDFKAGTVQRQISRRVRNAQGRLDDLERTQVSRPTPVLSFAGIPKGSHSLDDDSALLTVDDVTVHGRLAIDALSIGPRERMLVTGQNGAGKSTLLAVLAGTLSPHSGSVRRRKGLRVQLLQQDVRFADPAISVVATYEAVLGERRAQNVPLASLGLIAARDHNRAVGALSIGQQRRLALALIIARPPHLFLLDEPTNHLSLTLATELEEALGSYPGAVVVASHDRWLRRRWHGRSVHLPSTDRAVAHR